MIILVGMRFGTVGLVGWVLLHTVVEMRVEQGRCDKVVPIVTSWATVISAVSRLLLMTTPGRIMGTLRSKACFTEPALKVICSLVVVR